MQRCFAAESQVHVNKNSYLSSLTGRMSVPSYLFCMWISTGMKVTVGCWDRLLLFCPKAGGIAVLVVLGSNSRFTLMRLLYVFNMSRTTVKITITPTTMAATIAPEL